jgi:hypothetical protein
MVAARAAVTFCTPEVADVVDSTAALPDGVLAFGYALLQASLLNIDPTGDHGAIRDDSRCLRYLFARSSTYAPYTVCTTLAEFSVDDLLRTLVTSRNLLIASLRADSGCWRRPDARLSSSCRQCVQPVYKWRFDA